jgi:membrane protein DedA with SNARE-associated domain/rhodanese-related sulfurtransferase
MDIPSLTQALARDGAWVVLLNVLLQQVGLPIPAVPTLMVAGSLAGWSPQAGLLLAAAVLASVVADGLWYLAGRAFGYRVLSVLCRLSINPGSCVTQTEERFLRWGVWSLVIAKFVPGFSTVAPPIAGALRMPLPRGSWAAAVGAALWAGAALLAGWLLRDQLQATLALMDGHEALVLALLALALGLWIAARLWQKRRFERAAAIPHIGPAELMQAMRSARPPLLLDLRGASMLAATGPVAGASPAALDRLHEVVGQWPKDHPIVTFCACPQDATAVRAAGELVRAGYTAVRPLAGGYDAWMRQLASDSLKTAAPPA